jgi:hypothetical protein
MLLYSSRSSPNLARDTGSALDSIAMALGIAVEKCRYCALKAFSKSKLLCVPLYSCAIMKLVKREEERAKE